MMLRLLLRLLLVGGGGNGDDEEEEEEEFEVEGKTAAIFCLFALNLVAMFFGAKV